MVKIKRNIILAVILLFTINIYSFADSSPGVVAGTTLQYPYNTIARVITNAGGGTAFLVSPYLYLTAGHVVYYSQWLTVGIILPGTFYSTSNSYPSCNVGTYPEEGRCPYGHEEHDDVYSVASNTLWTEHETPDYDYGAIKMKHAANSGINTYMPLVFGDNLNGASVNSNGYPANESELPAHTGGIFVQWHNFAPVTMVQPNGRRFAYDAAGYEGMSGSPVWRYNASLGTRRVVGIYTKGNPSEGSSATAFMSRNRSLIQYWCGWTPPSAKNKLAAISWETLSTSGKLLNGKHLQASQLLNPKTLGLITRSQDSRSYPQPNDTVMQWIENTFYVWQEYKVPAKDGHAKLYIKMIKPVQRFLSVKEAQMLLSASRLWDASSLQNSITHQNNANDVTYTVKHKFTPINKLANRGPADQGTQSAQ